jgi:hypothetical protein
MNTGDLFGQYIEPALGGAIVVVIMVVGWLWRHPGVMNLIVLIAITNFVVNFERGAYEPAKARGAR